MALADREVLQATATAASGVDFVGAALVMDLTAVTPIETGRFWAPDRYPFVYATAANSDNAAVYGISLQVGSNQNDRFECLIRGTCDAAVYNGSSTSIAVGDPLSLGRTGTAAAMLYKAVTGENIVAFAMEAVSGTASAVNIVNAPRLKIFKPAYGCVGVVQ